MNICSQLVCGFFLLFFSHFTFALLAAVYKEKNYYWAELRSPYWWGHPEQSQLFMTPLGKSKLPTPTLDRTHVNQTLLSVEACFLLSLGPRSALSLQTGWEKNQACRKFYYFFHMFGFLFFFKAHLKWNLCRTWSLWLSAEVTIGVSIIIHVCIQRRMGHIFTVIFKRKSWQRWEDAFSQYATNYFSRTSSAAWFYILQGNFIRSHRYGNK